MTIVEFLEARLAEDEAYVRELMALREAIVDPRHITRREEREAAAKRAIIAGPNAFVPEHWRTWVLTHLAAVYADHSDYDPDWATRP